MIDILRRTSQKLIRFRALILVAFLATGCHGQDSGASSAGGDSKPVPSVSITKPRQTSFAYKIEQPGEIQAYEQAPIYARLSGYVDAVKKDIGDHVEKGNQLAVLSVPEMVAEHEQKLALVDQAATDVQLAEKLEVAAAKTVESMAAKAAEASAARPRGEAELERAESQYQRLKQSRAVISTDVLEESRLGAEIARASLKEIDARIKSAAAVHAESEARHDKAVIDIAAARSRRAIAEADERRLAALLEFAILRAPFTGYVTQRNVDPGHFLQPNPGSKVEAVFVIARTDTVRIFVDVPEVDAVLVKNEMPALVRVPALHGEEFKGEVKRSAWSLDAKGRTLRTEIDLKNADGRLRPNMYAYATILVDRENARMIPFSAVITKGDKTYCVLVDDESKARLTPVRLGVREGQDVEIAKRKTPGKDGTWVDLNGDEKIVTSQPGTLTDGQEVAIK